MQKINSAWSYQSWLKLPMHYSRFKGRYWSIIFQKNYFQKFILQQFLSNQLRDFDFCNPISKLFSVIEIRIIKHFVQNWLPTRISRMERNFETRLQIRISCSRISQKYSQKMVDSGISVFTTSKVCSYFCRSVDIITKFSRSLQIFSFKTEKFVVFGEIDTRITEKAYYVIFPYPIQTYKFVHWAFTSSLMQRS